MQPAHSLLSDDWSLRKQMYYLPKSSVPCFPDPDTAVLLFSAIPSHPSVRAKYLTFPVDHIPTLFLFLRIHIQPRPVNLYNPYTIHLREMSPVLSETIRSVLSMRASFPASAFQSPAAAGFLQKAWVPAFSQDNVHESPCMRDLPVYSTQMYPTPPDYIHVFRKLSPLPRIYCGHFLSHRKDLRFSDISHFLHVQSGPKQLFLPPLQPLYTLLLSFQRQFQIPSSGSQYKA